LSLEITPTSGPPTRAEAMVVAGGITTAAVDLVDASRLPPLTAQPPTTTSIKASGADSSRHQRIFMPPPAVLLGPSPLHTAKRIGSIQVARIV
jgi:hypothetical protein